MNHKTKIMERIEAILIKITELILFQTSFIKDTVHYSKVEKLSSVLGEYEVGRKVN